MALIADEDISSITVKIDDVTKADIKTGSKGGIRVERTDTTKQMEEKKATIANVRCTMGNEEKKEYLKQYRKACRKLETLQEQAKSLREVQSSAKAQQISDMPKGSSRQSDLSDIIVKFEELQRKINDKIKESLALRLEIENAILTVEGAEEAMVLRMRYIEFMRWEDIAEHMKYATAQIYRIHGRAIKQLKLKKNKDDSK